MVQTARDLVAHTPYQKPDLSQGLTRKATANQEWVFGAAGGNDFMIKFDKNFVKKHLFLYSKKTSQVAAMAAQLWDAAGKPSGRDTEFWLQAELAAFDAKVGKILRARAEKWVCTCGRIMDDHPCAGCGHGKARHLTNSGNPCACKEPGCACVNLAVTFPCPATGCANFTPTTGAYAASRAAAAKPGNPLAGASTMANTCLVLDRITMTDFKSVVIDAIQAAETSAFSWPAAPPVPVMPPVPNGLGGGAVKHVRWNFEARNLGCVIKADLRQDPAHWGKGQGVEVSMVKIGATPNGRGGTLYQYCVFHLSGDF